MTAKTPDRPEWQGLARQFPKQNDPQEVVISQVAPAPIARSVIPAEPADPMTVYSPDSEDSETDCSDDSDDSDSSTDSSNDEMLSNSNDDDSSLTSSEDWKDG